MSDDQKKAEGARAYLRSQMNPLVRPLYDSIERDEFVFKGPQGEALTLKSGELTPETLSRMAASGYTGSLPLSNPNGGWTEGKLENLKDFSLQELSELPVLKGRSGARVYLQEASQVAARELGERELEAFGDAIARTGSFGLASPSTPIASFREQQVAEANPLAAAGGALVGTLPFAAGVSALASKAVPAVLPMLGGRVAPVGAAALETGTAAAEGTLAARIGAGVAEDLAVELVANTQLSLADHALYDEELTAQSLASDIVPNTIFGGALALGLRGASAAVGKALKPMKKETSPAGELFAGPQKQRELIEELKTLDDPVEVARLVGDRVTEAVATADGMSPGTAKAALDQMPAARAAVRKTAYDMVDGFRAISGLESTKAFSNVKSGMSLDSNSVQLAGGALRNISNQLDSLITTSGQLDARAYKLAKDKIDNVRVMVDKLAAGEATALSADKFITTIDDLADDIFDMKSLEAPSAVARDTLQGMQTAIRDGIKHNPAVLGSAGELMRKADQAAVMSIEAVNGMRKYIGKDLNPEALATALSKADATGNMAYVFKYTDDLTKAADLFAEVGTKEALEHATNLRAAATKVLDGYAQLFAKNDSGLSPFETLRVATAAGKKVQEAAKRGALRAVLDSSIVAGGFALNVPGLAYIATSAINAIHGAWKAGGSTGKVRAFGAAHQANSRFFEGIRRGQAALSSALSGKAVRPIAGAAGAVGIAGYRGYKSAEEKRRAFEDLSKRISELTSDPTRFTQELEEGLGPFASFDRAVADEMAMTAFRQMQYLNETLPQTNYGPFAGDMSDSVSDSDIDVWMSVAHILQQPSDVLQEAAAGTLEPQQVEALRITSPKLYNELVGAALDAVGDTKDIPFALVSSLSTLVGFPLDPLLEGSFMYHAQNMGAQTQAQDQAINGQGQRRANLPSKSMITQVTRIEGA